MARSARIVIANILPPITQRDNKSQKIFFSDKACLETRKTYQERSRETLEQALEKIPFYSAWQELDPCPAVNIDERFAAMPV